MKRKITIIRVDAKKALGTKIKDLDIERIKMLARKLKKTIQKEKESESYGNSRFAY